MTIGAASLAMLAGTAGVSAQFEKTISATFDGWNKMPDGSYDLVFGYMNRNTSEAFVPLGSANTVEPAPADRGQPTNFLPGRQRNAFRIHVPADFKGKYVWTLTYAGTTQTASGSLDQNYSLDVGDPEPPSVAPGPEQTINVTSMAHLTPVVKAPPRAEVDPNADVVARRSTGVRITVWWSKFRGPGAVTFGDGVPVPASSPSRAGRDFPLGSYSVTCANPPAADCGGTTARFSEPGTYLLRVVAAERSASNTLMTVTVTP